MRSPSNGCGSPSMQGQVGSLYGGVRYSRRGPWTVDRGPWTVDRGPWTVSREPPTDCYQRSLFESQPCVTELVAVIQRPNLRNDFFGVGECLPPEAADPPTLSLE